MTTFILMPRIPKWRSVLCNAVLVAIDGQKVYKKEDVQQLVRNIPEMIKGQCNSLLWQWKRCRFILRRKSHRCTWSAYQYSRNTALIKDDEKVIAQHKDSVEMPMIRTILYQIPPDTGYLGRMERCRSTWVKAVWKTTNAWQTNTTPETS